MAGRGDSNGNDPNGGDDRFDWIYGASDSRRSKGSGSGSQPGQDADPTVRIPVQPRPGVSPPRQTNRLPPPSQYGATPEPPRPPTPAWSKRRSAWSRPRTYVRLILALLVLWLAFLIAVPVVSLNKVDKVEFEPTAGNRPGDQPGTTYLIVGSDSRGDLSAEERKKLGTGDAGGQRTDTIMLLHTGDGPNLLMSIPRDTRVDVPGQGKNRLVNSAYSSGGPKLLTRTIEDTTGIRIDHYVEIGFGGFVDVVDAIGGVEICPKRRMKDRKAALDVQKGCQEADGPLALAYARTRKYGDDFGRVSRQREVVGAIGTKVKSPWSVLNPLRYWQLNQAAPGAIAVGDGMGVIDAVQFARAMTATSGDAGRTCTLPSKYADITGDGISEVLIDRDRADKLFDLITADKTDDITSRICSTKGLE